jgi:hypothetical protein
VMPHLCWGGHFIAPVYNSTACLLQKHPHRNNPKSDLISYLGIMRPSQVDA